MKSRERDRFKPFVLSIILCASTAFLSACTAGSVPSSSNGTGQPSSAASSSSQQTVSSSKPADYEKNEVRTVVESFGEAIKNVSLDASESDIVKSMKAAYAQYLTPNLFESWEGHPSVRAAGKLPVGPWPDRIEISEIVQNADHSYTVKGTLFEVKNKDQSDSVVSKRSADFKVVLSNGEWLIDECLFGNSAPVSKN